MDIDSFQDLCGPDILRATTLYSRFTESPYRQTLPSNVSSSKQGSRARSATKGSKDEDGSLTAFLHSVALMSEDFYLS